VDFEIIRRRMSFCMPSSNQVSTICCCRHVQVIVPSTLPNLCLFYWLPLHAVAIRLCQLGLNSSACVAADRADCNVARCITLLENNSFSFRVLTVYRSECMLYMTVLLQSCCRIEHRLQTIHHTRCDCR